MTQQVKRAPGRPKAQAEPQPKAKPAAKKTTLKREVKDTRNCVFEVINGGGIVWMLPQAGITVHDKETDTVRELRYCPNENSVWSDEQGPKAMKKSVVFRDGRLFVREDQPNLRRFLDLHPHNVANGGYKFKLVDRTNDAKKEMEQEFLQHDAVSKVRDTDITDLLAIALYFKVNINADTSEIRHNLLRIAKKNPKGFLESFDSPQVRARAIIKQAADYQIINLRPDSCKWYDSNSMIVSVPVGQDPTDVMVRFCLTEKGASVLSDLEERLEKLA